MAATVSELSYRVDKWEKHPAGLLIHDMVSPGIHSYSLKQSPYRIILILSFRVAEGERVGQKARHENITMSSGRSKCCRLLHLNAAPCSFESAVCCCVLSNPDADADGATDAADAATLGPAAGRAEAASGAVACAGSAAMGLDRCISCLLRWNQGACASGAHGEARGQARGEAIAMDLCSPPSKHPRTSCQSQVGLPCPKPQVVSTHVKPPERRSCLWLMAKCPRTKAWRDAPNWLQEILGAEPLQVLLGCSVVPVPLPARLLFQEIL